MATDFFERQAAARSTTAWLVAMFGLGAGAVVVTVTAIAALAVAGSRDRDITVQSFQSGDYPWQAPIGVGLGTLALVGGGSLFKTAMLRAGGGTGVAESLGGKRLDPGSADPTARRLLNVVDEMAIASGVPSPPVFLLDEPGVNAFAAGYSPSDAVIGVTRGCVESLSRDELQGVIAHEFSHILNGDMRMSVRMIGVLHGILLLGLVGQIIVRTIFNSGIRVSSGRSDGKGGGAAAAVLIVLAIGAALIVIGSIGSLVGGLLKAAVSRQREYLADASAVQFTRNPGGIGGALKRILASAGRGWLKHPRAAEMSHMYFAQGVWEGFTSLMATHPPLERRILAIEPTWDGSLPAFGDRLADVGVEGAAGFAGGHAHELDRAPVAAVEHASEHVGDPQELHRRYAREMLAIAPEGLLNATRETYSARAVVFALLLDRDETVRAKQLAALTEHVDEGLLLVVRRLTPDADALDARLRLPLVDLTLPALAGMTPRQYQKFTRSFQALVLADEKIGLFEWALAQILLRHLRPKFEAVRERRVELRTLGQLAEPLATLLSTLAHAGQRGADAERAFKAAAARLEGVSLRLRPDSACGLDPLREALEVLSKTTEVVRGNVIDAAAAAICVDRQVTVVEAELLRGISDLLDCPMPPLLAGQKIVDAPASVVG
ncbi:MAG: M48 family metalloprotease [Lacipirellulaceae bacterium]